MKKILGLDLGTNSIGWALIDKQKQEILGLGTRIVPMGDDKGNFEAGKKITRNAVRRMARGARRGNHRYKLRRNKLLYVLHRMNMLSDLISFGYFKIDELGNENKVLGQFPTPERLQKVFVLPIRKGNKRYKGDTALSILELREKALTQPVPLKELGRLFYLFNQRRGYSGGGDDEEKEATNKEGETERVKKVYREVMLVTKPVALQHSEEVKIGKHKKRYPIYKIKLVNTATGETFEGTSIKNIPPESESHVTLVKSSSESKQIRLRFPDDEVIWTVEGTDIIEESFHAKVLECKPVQEFKKKKWVYNIEITDNEENEDEKIESGLLFLKHTSHIEKIKLNESNEFEINITTKSNGEKTFEFFLPNKSNWKKNLESIEKSIAETQKAKKEAGDLDAIGNGNYHICHYFLDKLKTDDNGHKIRDNVILRKRYRAEFNAIWEKQYQCNPEFKNLVDNKEVLEEVINYIFPDKPGGNNPESGKEKFKADARIKGLKYVIAEQIIYYQRKLKSQEDLIGGCQYETELDENKKPKHRVIERSHPLFQEFRMWDQINKCYVDQRNPDGSKYKYSKRFLSTEEKLRIYNKLNEKKEFTYEGWCGCLNISYEGKGKEKRNIDWPRGLNKKEKFKGNETAITIKSLLGESLFEKAFGNKEGFIHYENEEYLRFYNILFDSAGTNELDIDDDRVQNIRKFLGRYISNIDTPEGLDMNTYLDKRALEIARYKFPRKYASLSEKVIKNLMPLMQVKEENTTYPKEHQRKLSLLDSIYEKFKYRFKEYTPEEEQKPEHEKISKAMLLDFYREYRILQEPLDKGGWPYWAAAGLLYGRHTARQLEKINDYHEIQPLSREETLRNPIVEQMVNETLQTIKFILKDYEIKPDELEIRIELARELKNNAKERESLHDAMLRNAKENRFAAYEIMQLEYEDGKKKINPEYYCKENGCTSICYKSAALKQPTLNQILKFRLWKEQGMLSPYTGQPIPLCKLFDGSLYNKEHIIPKQRFFDNSQSNQVIAETVINKSKDNLTAIEFIRQYGGKMIAGVKVKTLSQFENDVMNHPTLGMRKKKMLLLKEIPEDFIERQKKETQYIARKVKEKLGSIVGLDNVTTTTGEITDHLKDIWGINEVFKEITKRRFEIMAVMAGEEKGKWCHYKEVESRSGGRKKVLVLEQWSKRLDHRHHAIDALIVACTTQAQVQKLNTLNQAVQEKLRQMYAELKNNKEISDEEISKRLSEMNEDEKRKFQAELSSLKQFDYPWDMNKFMVEARDKIEKLIVSFKSKKRLLIQNREDKNGKRTNELVLKVRGALHQATVYGKVFEEEQKENVRIKTAFEFSDFILEPEIREKVIQRIEEYNGDIDEAIESLGSKDGKLKDNQGKIIKSATLYFTEKDAYRIPLSKFAEKKNAEGIIDRVIDKTGHLKNDLYDHLYRYSIERKLEQLQEDNEEFEPELNSKIEDLLKTDTITNEIFEKFISDIDATARKKIRSWINGKLAFSEDGIDDFNSRRQKKNCNLKPVYGLKVLYAKTAGESTLKPIKRKHREEGKGEYDYVKPGDNYCYIVLQKNETRDFLPVTFFDAARWVTDQFRQDIQNYHQFPKSHDERIEYIEKIIKSKVAELRPGFEILYLLQQDDLVYLPFDKEDALLAISNPDHVFWFNTEKKRWKRIYRVVKFSGSRCYFIPYNYASPINYKPVMDKEEKKQRENDGNEIPKEGIYEFGTYKNCSPFEITEEYIIESLRKKNRKFKPNSIQDKCIKIQVDRLGNIKPL